MMEVTMVSVILTYFHGRDNLMAALRAKCYCRQNQAVIELRVEVLKARKNQTASISARINSMIKHVVQEAQVGERHLGCWTTLRPRS